MVKKITVEQRDEAAAIFKAQSDPARLQLLLILAVCERNLRELAEMEGDKK